MEIIDAIITTILALITGGGTFLVKKLKEGNDNKELMELRMKALEDKNKELESEIDRVDEKRASGHKVVCDKIEQTRTDIGDIKVSVAKVSDDVIDKLQRLGFLKTQGG